MDDQTHTQLKRQEIRRSRETRLSMLIEEARLCILAASERSGNPGELERLAIAHARRKGFVRLSPIVISIVIQLIPLLIKWFLDNRPEFDRQIGSLSTEVLMAISDDQWSVEALQHRATSLESQVASHVPPGSDTNTMIAGTRIQKILMVAALVRVLSGFIDFLSGR